MATHSSILAWRIPGMAEPGGLLSMGLHRVRHDGSNLAAAAARCLAGRIKLLESAKLNGKGGEEQDGKAVDCQGRSWRGALGLMFINGLEGQDSTRR